MKTYAEQTKEQQKEVLSTLIEWAGNKSVLARLLGVSPQAVAAWVLRGRISAKKAITAESLTSGVITKEQLRPDVINWEK